SRSRLQDLIRPPQLRDLALETLDLLLRLARHARPSAGVDLHPADPLPHRLRRADAEELGDVTDRLVLAVVVRSHLRDHPDGALAQLDRVLTGTSHETDPSEESSLRTCRGDSVWLARRLVRLIAFVVSTPLVLAAVVYSAALVMLGTMADPTVMVVAAV